MNVQTTVSVVLGLLFALSSVSPAFAQGSTGIIKGQIVDASGEGVYGMTVALSDGGKGLTRSVTTNSIGRFQLQLAPGTYVLKTSGQGYTAVTVEQVSLNVAAVTEMTIPVRDSAIEEIVVYGTAKALMATATGETSLNISLEELAKLPVARSIEAVALLAPGTVPGIVAFGDDKTLVSFGGASVAENVYYIDGLNVTNFSNGMGGSSVPFEFYDQFQIKTGGYSAEFGRSTGGVINSVTRRGGNEFEYGVVTYFEPELLQGASPDTVRPDGSYYDFNSENSQSSTTTDLYASGPIIKDRLFFFVLYEPQSSSEQYNRRGSADTLVKVKAEDDFGGGNLTWNITDNHALSYTAFSDERDIVKTLYDYDLDNKTTGSLIGDATNYRGGDNFIVSYEGWLSNNFNVSALFGKNERNLTDLSSNDNDCPYVVDERDSSTSAYAGCWINARIETASDEREAYRLDLTYVLGNHTLRAGFDREDNVSSNAVTYTGQSSVPDLVGGAHYRYLTYDVGDPLYPGELVPDYYGDGSPVDIVLFNYLSQHGTFDTISRAWYVEDTWEINNALNLSLGIRNETFENYNGVGDLFFDIKDQWAPRFAVSWSPGDRRNQSVTLNWGRYHLPIMALPNVVMGAAYLEYARYFIFDGNMDDTTGMPVAVGTDGIPTTRELGSAFILGDGSVPDVRGQLDTSLEPMYQDEWIIAYEREFGDGMMASVRYVNRELQSLIEDVATIARFENDYYSPYLQCWFVMTNPGTDMTTFCDLDGDGTLEETFIPAENLGFPKARRTYEALELTFKKLFANAWSLQGSYTWSKNKGNTEGSVKSDKGQDMANLTEDFDFRKVMDGAYGYLPNDRRHNLKLWTSYEATERLTLGASLFAQSGRPINSFGKGHPDLNSEGWYGSTFYLQQPDGSYEFTPRGTAGRTDWVVQLNLAAVYSFDWGDYANVELRAEIFNMLNADGATEVYEYPEARSDQFKLPKQYQQPRYLRFGAAVRF